MILIVDDKPENIFALKSILELHSFSIDTAASGEEALKKTLKCQYALIILDVQMPDMDGFEVAEILAGNSHTRDTPIIFLSAVNTSKKFITKGYSSGAIDYIVKPIDPEILLLKVMTFNRLYQQNRELNQVQQHLKLEIDIRKKAQLQMQEKAQELNSILESIPQIAFTASGTGSIDFVNEKWYDYTSSTLHFPATHLDDPGIDESWTTAIANGEKMEMEVRIKKNDQNYFRYHLLRVVPLKEGSQIVKWVGTFTDIEEQKLAVKKKDEFLTIASHELKTPLTSIKAYVQLLDQLTPEDNKAKPYVDRTLVQVNKLDSLINDLLDISKIESDKLIFELSPLNFEEILNSTLDILYKIHPSYTIVKKGNATIKILGNAVRLEQVIINFLTNAIKYGGESKEIHVHTELLEDNKMYFGVQDFGIGLSVENQTKIFNKFYRVNENQPHIQGLGIGLYICSEILKMHHAGFGVKSEIGNGAEFYFVLPVIQSSINN